MSSVIHDRDELERKIEEAGEKLIVIDFFANWCGPCKVISPKLEELAKQYEQQAAVFKVNVDDCEDIALDFNVTSMPTFVFMRNKNVVDTFVGGNTDKLVQSMQKYVTGSDDAVPVATRVEDEQAGASASTAAEKVEPAVTSTVPPEAAPSVKNKMRLPVNIERKSRETIPENPGAAGASPNPEIRNVSSAGALQPAANQEDKNPSDAAKDN